MGLIILATLYSLSSSSSLRLKVVLDAEWLDREADDTVLVDFSLDCVIHDFDIDVVVNVGLLGLFVDESDGKALPVASRDSFVVFDLAGGGQVIDDPVVVVVLANGFDDLVGIDASLLAPSQVGNAELFAVHVRLHGQAVGRALDAIAHKELSEVFIVHLGSSLWCAKGKSVVINGHERLARSHFVHLEFHANDKKRQTSSKKG